MYTVEDIRKDLENIGIKKGDILLVRADLGAVGKMASKTDYVEALIDAVGPSGTIIGLAFTKSMFIKRNKNSIFKKTTAPYTGALASIMLKYPNSCRSTHPTNSYVAIGRNAQCLTEKHTEESGAYDLIQEIIDLDGKMILIGCVNKSPGFTTTHLAETHLNLHKRIIFPWLNTAYYEKNGELQLFKRQDIGSCSSTFYKLYGDYLKSEALTQGYVGKAYSIIIDAKKAYEIDYSILRKNPKITICEKPDCFLCRARRWDNIFDLPGFIARKVYLKTKDYFIKKQTGK